MTILSSINLKLLIFLILCCLIKPQSALTAENLLAVANGYRDDVIYLQLGANDMKNPVVHEEDNELQEIEDELPENNTEIDETSTKIFNKSKKPSQKTFELLCCIIAFSVTAYTGCTIIIKTIIKITNTLLYLFICLILQCVIIIQCVHNSIININFYDFVT